MIRTIRACQFKYQALFGLIKRAIIAGLCAIIFLHFFAPAAEHPKILNTIGLMLDIIGVTWIAYDLFPFDGKREFTENEVSGIETPAYTEFKRIHAAQGLTLIVIGFLFQIIAYWISDILEIAERIF